MKPAPLIKDTRWYDYLLLLLPVIGWIMFFETIDNRHRKISEQLKDEEEDLEEQEFLNKQ